MCLYVIAPLFPWAHTSLQYLNTQWADSQLGASLCVLLCKNAIICLALIVLNREERFSAQRAGCGAALFAWLFFWLHSDIHLTHTHTHNMTTCCLFTQLFMYLYVVGGLCVFSSRYLPFIVDVYAANKIYGSIYYGNKFVKTRNSKGKRQRSDWSVSDASTGWWSVGGMPYSKPYQWAIRQ